ncbi:glycosyl transferase family 2, partial [mine drainage metagenome]
MFLSLLSLANTLLCFQVLVLLIFLIINGSYTYVTIFAFRHLRKSVDARPDLAQLLALTKSANMRPISIVVPAYNEQVTILDTVLAATRINYPEFEILIVNDGSTDETLQRL